jgi:hypothetical protein
MGGMSQVRERERGMMLFKEADNVRFAQYDIMLLDIHKVMVMMKTMKQR